MIPPLSFVCCDASLCDQLLLKYKSQLTIKESANGLQAENQEKNRNNDIIPSQLHSDAFLVFLLLGVTLYY